MKVSLKKNYYASLCYYSLKQLGLVDGQVNPKYKAQSQRLSQLGRDFSFCPPAAGGPIFTLVYQIPGYINPTTVDELKEIGYALRRFVEEKRIDVFLSIWPHKTKYWSDWYTPGWMEYLFRGLYGKTNRALAATEYYIDFLCQLWQPYQDIYTKKLADYPFAQLQHSCQQIRTFEKWQEELGVGYPYDDFYLNICPESGTSASSLGPEQIVFGAKHSWQKMKNALVHEVGVRFMDLGRLSKQPATAELMRNDYFGIIMLIEAEVCYRKPNLLPELKSDPFIRGMGLENLVQWRSQQQEYDLLPDLFSKHYKLAKDAGLI